MLWQQQEGNKSEASSEPRLACKLQLEQTQHRWRPKIERWFLHKKSRSSRLKLGCAVTVVKCCLVTGREDFKLLQMEPVAEGHKEQ